MTENDYAQNCHDDDLAEKLAIIKLWTRVKNLENKLKDVNRYLAVQEREYKSRLPIEWSAERKEESWEGYLNGK